MPVTRYWATFHGPRQVAPVGMHISQVAKLKELCESMETTWANVVDVETGEVLATWHRDDAALARAAAEQLRRAK